MKKFLLKKSCEIICHNVKTPTIRQQCNCRFRGMKQKLITKIRFHLPQLNSVHHVLPDTDSENRQCPEWKYFSKDTVPVYLIKNKSMIINGETGSSNFNWNPYCHMRRMRFSFTTMRAKFTMPMKRPWHLSDIHLMS